MPLEIYRNTEGGFTLRYIDIIDQFLENKIQLANYKILYENRMCNQWDNWRAYGPELLL